MKHVAFASYTCTQLLLLIIFTFFIYLSQDKVCGKKINFLFKFSSLAWKWGLYTVFSMPNPMINICICTCMEIIIMNSRISYTFRLCNYMHYQKKENKVYPDL